MRFLARLMFLFILTCAPPAAWAAGAGAPTSDQVKAWAEKAIALRVESQKALAAFAEVESKMLDEAERLRDEIKRISRARKKTEAYLADQLAKIAGIRRELAEIETIRSGLEPVLDDSLARLKTQVEKKPPFDPQARIKRMALLQAALNNYDLSLAQKAKQLFSALAVEARSGVSVEVDEGEISFENRTLSVRKIRLGGIGLFAVDLGKEQAWRWDSAKGSFESLNGWAGELSKLADMAQRKRLVSLVEVPLGRKPEEAAAK